MHEKKQPSHARLRLTAREGQADRCSESNLSAESPFGDPIRSCSISETVDAASPITPPISAKVIPFARRSVMREAQVTSGIVAQSLRDTVTETQRHPITTLRESMDMARPPDLPKFDELGARIAYWRKKRGWDRRDLAKRAKIPYSTLAGIEKGSQKSATKVPQIAAALGLNPLYLNTDKGDPEAGAPPELLDWPFPFAREELNDFDPNELELAGMKLQVILEDIRKKRPNRRAKRG